MLKVIKKYIYKMAQQLFAKELLCDLQSAKREIARLKRTIVYYQFQQQQVKKALGLELTSNHQMLLEMAKDPANHKWKANSELVTMLVATIRRLDEQKLYLTQDELEEANGQGVIADWDTEKNCARIKLTQQEYTEIG